MENPENQKTRNQKPTADRMDRMGGMNA